MDLSKFTQVVEPDAIRNGRAEILCDQRLGKIGVFVRSAFTAVETNAHYTKISMDIQT